MPRTCIVFGCPLTSTHHFPNDVIRYTQWCRAIKFVKPNMCLKKSSMICSAHFRRSDFTPSTTFRNNFHDYARNVLKKTAVPSMFPWNSDKNNERDSSSDCDDADPIHAEESLTFDPTTVKADYSRTRPIAYAEEQLVYMDTESIKLTNDPLNTMEIKKELEESEFNSAGANTLESDCIADEEELSRNMDETQECDQKPQPNDKSVQTDDHITIVENLISGFSIYHYKDSDKSINFYTGLENFEKVMLVFTSLEQYFEDFEYFYDEPPSIINKFEQFFVTILILRRHQSFTEISMLYKITTKQVHCIFVNWIRFMFIKWRSIDLWYDKKKIKANMPVVFRDKYPQTRVVLYTLDIPIEKPQGTSAQRVTFSSHFQNHTIKVVVGVTPGGLISYVSPTYGGIATDRQVIEKTAILNRLDSHDEVAVSKDLNIQDIFTPKGVKVTTPHFINKGNLIPSIYQNKGCKQLPVERAISRLKCYKILTDTMNHTETSLSCEIVSVCAVLVNFRSNLLNKKV